MTDRARWLLFSAALGFWDRAIWLMEYAEDHWETDPAWAAEIIFNAGSDLQIAGNEMLKMVRYQQVDLERDLG